MRVGFLGLGRLGLPIAAILSQHHRVTGYDPDPSTAARLVNGHPWEEGLSEYLGDVALTTSVDAATWDADVVVICVQTPHEPRKDGTWPGQEAAPFDLSYVRAALSEVHADVPVVLMSTVLPGDCRSLGRDNLIYAPAFPAMGTTVRDFLDPEFFMFGAPMYPDIVDLLFNPVWDQPLYWHHVSWETAELAKMAYNTAIGAKIALANTIGWMAEEVGADGGQVMRILSNAHRRITSPAYLQPGLGDGGACHPRDQLALSYLAQKLGVYDLFRDIITQREAHSDWLIGYVEHVAARSGLEPIILGSAYKANSTLDDGSPALLMANQSGWDITNDPEECHGRVVVIGVPHDEYAELDLPDSLIVDPWGIVPGALTPGRVS